MMHLLSEQFTDLQVCSCARACSEKNGVGV